MACQGFNWHSFHLVVTHSTDTDGGVATGQAHLEPDKSGASRPPLSNSERALRKVHDA